MKDPDNPVWARLKIFEEKYPGVWWNYIETMGFTGRSTTDEGDPDNDESAFPGSGDFESNWDVWYEIKDVIEPADVSELLDDLEGFIAIIDEKAPHLLAQIMHEEDADGTRARFANHFHYTRNGHGVGFWDGQWDEGFVIEDAGTLLTEWSKTFGTCELEVEWTPDPDNDDEPAIAAVYLSH